MPNLDEEDLAWAQVARMRTDYRIFDRLEGPEYIESLREKGYFRHPPDPLIDEKGEFVVFPVWPAMRYLARVAGQKPDIVADIIQGMEETHNAMALSDAVEALLAMPARISIRLLGKVIQWASLPYLFFLLAVKLGRLMAQWAEAGLSEEALRVARVLLDIFPERYMDAKISEIYRFPPDPSLRFAPMDFEEILRRHYSKVVEVVGIPALELLCALLEKALDSWKECANGQELGDNSYVWDTTIEEYVRNPRDVIREALDTAIREATNIITETRREAAEVVLNILAQKRSETPC